MSALDLTAAVEAATEAVLDPDYIGCSCCAQTDGIDYGQDNPRERAIATQAVTAAAPLIEAAVREQIAAEIEASAPYEGIRAQRVIDMCARIARATR